MSKRCLYCYQELEKETADFHEKCSRKFFGSPEPPLLDYSIEQMQDLAQEIVTRSVTVTGVQPKLSLELQPPAGDPKRSRLTIVGLWGSFILKPPTETFPHLPENEDLTMHLSELFGITTAEHSLIRLRSGELAYLTKRFDRTEEGKLAMEDMCQLTETLTADKYRSSMEKVGKYIVKFSDRPGLDAVNFFETALFCFLTGNADMHLKNFSLLTTAAGDTILSPAYDLVCTKVAMPADAEEMALTINARKRKIGKRDFDSFADSLKIPARSRDNSYARFSRKIMEAFEWIDHSFLPQEMKRAYKEVVGEHGRKAGIISN